MADASLSLPRARFGAVALRALGDDRLGALAAQGDERAFAVIFERHHQALYRYCRSILGNDEDAADALQSAMLRALRALPGETRMIALKPWLYRIAHNEAITLLRRRRDQDALGEEPAPASSSPEARVIARERVNLLFEDLRELPDRQRGAIVMRELGGLAYEEIAAAFETSRAAAVQAVFDARKTLHDFEAGRDMRCDAVQREISRRDGRVLLSRRLRAHMRACPDCTRFRSMIGERREEFAVLAPVLPAAAAAALLEGLRSGGGAAGGGGLVALLGLGGGKALVSSAALKVTAGVAAAGAVGVSAAVVVPSSPDRSPPAARMVAPLPAAAAPAAAVPGAGAGAQAVKLPGSAATRPAAKKRKASAREPASKPAHAVPGKARHGAPATAKVKPGAGRQRAAAPHGRGNAGTKPKPATGPAKAKSGRKRPAARKPDRATRARSPKALQKRTVEPLPGDGPTVVEPSGRKVAGGSY